MKIYKKLKRRYRRWQGRREVAKHGVWFVDVPRTSSTSIRVELGKYLGPVYGKSNIIEKEYIVEKVFSGHQTAQKMSAFFGEELWGRLFTFTMVRNPWGRTYSMFNYRRKLAKIPSSWSFRDYVLELDRSVYDLSQGASPKFKHYSQFYDAETQGVIRRLYADDIELFSYEFDDES